MRRGGLALALTMALTAPALAREVPMLLRHAHVVPLSFAAMQGWRRDDHRAESEQQDVEPAPDEQRQAEDGDRRQHALNVFGKGHPGRRGHACRLDQRGWKEKLMPGAVQAGAARRRRSGGP